jgi:hypothetical protein
VDPEGAKGDALGILSGRKSRVIEGGLGYFDNFLAALYRELTCTPGGAPQVGETGGREPFEFLDYYRETDKERFVGSEEVIKDLIQLISGENLPTAVEKVEVLLPKTLPSTPKVVAVHHRSRTLSARKDWCGGLESNWYVPYGTKDFNFAALRFLSVSFCP